MKPNLPIFPPITDHPFRGPFLEVSWLPRRCDALRRHVNQLVDSLGFDHPHTALARSWFAVAHGSEAFDQRLLATLEHTEPVLREHFPEAHKALALNVAAQGCHLWFLRSAEDAIPKLKESFELMWAHQDVCEADCLKVAEVLADCLSKVGRIDEALDVLARAYPLYLAALEQSEFLAAQYDEFRGLFIAKWGDECAAEFQDVVDALRGPGVCQMSRASMHALTHEGVVS